MSRIIDKDMIIDFGEEVSTNCADKAYCALGQCFTELIKELSSRNNFITEDNVFLIKAFDYATNTATKNSFLDIFVAVKSAQVEINSLKTMTGLKNNLKRRIIEAYQRVKSRKKSAIRKKKKEEKKRKKEGLTVSDLTEKKEKSYSIISFKNDCFDLLIPQFSKMTMIYNLNNKIRVLSNEELGININLFPVIYLNGDYKMWNNDNGSFVSIKQDNARFSIKEKNDDVPNDNVLRLIRVFKNLYFNIYNSNNYRFIDSLVINLPDSIFDEDNIYDVFLKAMNYLSNTNISKYTSAYDKTKLMFEEDGVTVLELKAFLKEINNII